MNRPTHWLIVEHEGVEVGQIPLNPHDTPGHPNSPRAEARKAQHAKLLEEHKDMALGSRIKLSPDLYLQRSSII
jgi:hypothetical protein